jgi:hypothetical protein
MHVFLQPKSINKPSILPVPLLLDKLPTRTADIVQHLADFGKVIMEVFTEYIVAPMMSKRCKELNFD